MPDAHTTPDEGRQTVFDVPQQEVPQEPAHDEEAEQPRNGELPRDAAHRLIGRLVQPSVSHVSLDRAFQLLFTRLRQPYASALSAADQAAMLDWLESQLDTTRQLMNGVCERIPFRWPGE